MIYDIVMISLIVIGTVGVSWASLEMGKERKANKIKPVGKVRIDNEPK